MTPRRPYILRGLYDWLLDNELTPHLVVDARWPLVQVPHDYVHDDQIVLNIAPTAVQAFVMDNDGVRFRARFGGQDQRIELPIGSILAIYARENGAGMIFEPEEGIDFPTDNDSDFATERELCAVEEREPEFTTADESDAESTSSAAESDTNRPVRGKPVLRVVRDD